MVVFIILAYALLCYGSWYRFARRHAFYAKNVSSSAWLIGFASQNGFAEQMALQTAQQFQQAGIDAALLPFNKISEEHWLTAKKMLLITSTYGEGEAPDNGTRFLRQLPQQLSNIEYGVLALGDSQYAQFCAFGHAVDHAMRERGAKPLFDIIEVDNQDADSLRHYQYGIGKLTGEAWFNDWQKVDYQPWQLISREWLNPGSLGNPVFHLRLIPKDSSLETMPWQAGDIADIGPCNNKARIQAFLSAIGQENPAFYSLLARKNLPLDNSQLALFKTYTMDEVLAQLSDLPHREYSIASIPEQGALELLVRQKGSDETDFGLGSGWLNQFAEIGEEILLKVRSNKRFHLPEQPIPVIFIGNGTGIAGLRSLLQQRIHDGVYANWLLFGERSENVDFYFADEICEALSRGHLAQVNTVFSRDAAGANAPRYVQDILRLEAEKIRRWVQQGAAIYVCGSLDGMAQGVDQALRELLSDAVLQQLQDEGRYCRDVY